MQAMSKIELNEACAVNIERSIAPRRHTHQVLHDGFTHLCD
jgi:hypothetical protein